MILFFTRINNHDIPVDLQLKLIDHTVVPILTYACEIWGYENLDMIENVQNDFLRSQFQKKYIIIYAIWRGRALPVRYNHKIKNDSFFGTESFMANL